MTAPVDIIQASMEEIGAIDPGQTMTAADLNRAFTSFNQMLDSWSNENLACFALLTQTTPLIINKPFYTIGTSGGADIAQTRPLKINQAWLTDLGSADNRFYVEIVDQYDWNLISNLLITSQIPTTLFYDPQFPLGIINVYPIPDGGAGPYTLNWTSYLQLTDFANPYVNVVFPPGYVDAFQHNLAVRLYPFFKIPPSPLVLELASETKGIVKRTNIRLEISYFDRAITARFSGSYNIFNDDYGNRGNTVS